VKRGLGGPGPRRRWIGDPKPPRPDTHLAQSAPSCGYHDRLWAT
jgi:hypothetical protein